MAVPTLSLGFDVEKNVNENFNLHYGLTYLSFDTGRRYTARLSSSFYHKVSLVNFSQDIGMMYFFIPNIGVGVALNIDYFTNFKDETGSNSGIEYYSEFASLLYLGTSFNLRYIWRNIVIKVDYKHGIFDLNNGNKKVVNGTPNPLYPQKGFGFYLGYRFSF